MRTSRQMSMLAVALIVVLGRASHVTLAAGEKRKQVAHPAIARASQQPFPARALDLMAASRLKDARYFRLVAGDALLDVDPKVLYARMAAAAAAGETYKALYLARIFTQTSPEMPEAWSNRARLAAALGLERERAAAERRAGDPAGGLPVPMEGLPGQALPLRPGSIADWAGAILLMSDASAVAHPSALPAVRDDVSGIVASTAEETEQSPGRSPWARPEPIRLDDVLPNAFLLQSGQPMKWKTENSGSLFAGMALAMLAGAASAKNDAAAADTFAAASGDMFARAEAVKSHYVGGKYQAVSYVNGTARSANVLPRSTGVSHAVGMPVPLLWAAGGSMSGTARLDLKGTTTNWLMRVGDSEGKFKKGVDRLNVPKMATFASVVEGRGIRARPRLSHPPVLIKELLLTPADVEAFSQGSVRHPLNLETVDASYKGGRLMLMPHNLLLRGDERLEGYTIGWDDAGNVYYFSPGPTQWLLPARK